MMALLLTAALASMPVHAAKIPPPPCLPLTERQLSQTVTLSGHCYVVSSVETVKGAVTIGPGVRIVFTEGSSLYVDGGTLTARGSEASPIVFEGRDHTPGYWAGIQFLSNSTRNQLSYVQIHDAGQKGNDAGAVLVGVGGRLSMEHTLIRNAEGNGLTVLQRGMLSSFAANDFENTEIPLKVKASDLAMIDLATTFANNKKNYVAVYFGECTVSDDATWKALSVPYHFDCSPDIHAQVKIEPGAQLEFGENSGIEVTQNGSLTAVGTPEKPVVFTGADPTPGYWTGVYFESNSVKNMIENAKITYAGQDSSISGGVCVGVRARASVSSSEIAYAVAGIRVLQDGMLNADAESSNSFHDNKHNILREN